MHKSLGNGIDPIEIIDRYGADILRLWVASSDYHADIRISNDILKQLSEVYRKIRNTARYILGNLNDFNPDKDMVSDDKLLSIDKWALLKLDELVAYTRRSYEKYEFHTIFHAVHNFCVNDMSNFYLDVLKDRLYVEKADSVSRRAAQTTIYKILDSLTLLIAPILSFTAEEIWQAMPHDSSRESESVFFNNMPEAEMSADDDFSEKWDRIHAIRNDVNKALELARNEKLIGKSLEAKVTLFAQGELAEFLKGVEKELPSAFIVSQVEIAEGKGDFTGDVENLSVSVSRANGHKCARCWSFTEDVGNDSRYPDVCARCAEILS